MSNQDHGVQRPHENWSTWKLAMKLAIQIYRATRALPPREKFGFQSQMRRSAVSIPSNIAEGAGRGTERQLQHFLRIARGSLSELETQIKLAKHLELLNVDVVNRLLTTCGHLGRALQAFLNRLNT